jgi:hypothetical protein
MTAQEYFIIHDADLMNMSMNWNDCIQKCLRNCPIEVTDTTSIFKILGKRQQPDQKGSIYVQKIRLLIGNDFGKYNEQEIISLIMEGMQSDLRHCLECHGIPLTYADLVSKFQVYEERGLPRYKPTPSSSVPPALASTSWSPSTREVSTPLPPTITSVPLNYANSAPITSGLK